MTLGPHELAFVLEVPAAGTVSEHKDFDVYRPHGADRPLPAVIFLPGAAPEGVPVRPRQWPIYTGYGQLMAGRGVVGVVLELEPFRDGAQWDRLAEKLPGIVESVRALDEVDADRVALWAFSFSGLLIGRWLADSPDWLRCLALSYPVLAGNADVVRPGRPLVLTRAGKERPDWQAMVDRFLSQADTTGTAVRVVDVPNGQHGFDVADHTDESRRAVLEAADLVTEYLI